MEINVLTCLRDVILKKDKERKNETSFKKMKLIIDFFDFWNTPSIIRTPFPLDKGP